VAKTNQNLGGSSHLKLHRYLVTIGVLGVYHPIELNITTHDAITNPPWHTTPELWIINGMKKGLSLSCVMFHYDADFESKGVVAFVISLVALSTIVIMLVILNISIIWYFKRKMKEVKPKVEHVYETVTARDDTLSAVALAKNVAYGQDKVGVAMQDGLVLKQV